MEEQIVTTRHGRISAVDYGGLGPDLLLLHGAGLTLASWDLVRNFIQERRVVAMDFRWHGRSEDLGEVGLEPNADDVEDVIEALGLDNPFVAGHSLGGMVAAVYGQRHASCPGVANVDGHSEGTRDQYVGIPQETVTTYFEKIEDLRQQAVAPVTSGDADWFENEAENLIQMARSLGADFSASDPFIARSFARSNDGTWHSRPNSRYGPLLEELLTSIDMFHVYRRTNCPIVIYNCIRSSPSSIPNEAAVRAAYRRGLQRDLAAVASEKPNVHVETINCGHLSILEIPEKIAQSLLVWSGAS